MRLWTAGLRGYLYPIRSYDSKMEVTERQDERVEPLSSSLGFCARTGHCRGEQGQNMESPQFFPRADTGRICVADYTDYTPISRSIHDGRMVRWGDGLADPLIRQDPSLNLVR